MRLWKGLADVPDCVHKGPSFSNRVKGKGSKFAISGLGYGRVHGRLRRARGTYQYAYGHDQSFGIAAAIDPGRIRLAGKRH
ncbi:hypothetical protein BOTBODRAFT_38204 [Botryobasidium botryosum FD-172 SS1]|uniref:Uncharacterized protein n=1 Tax=Botryobasidium botryosum (strain FD-172 SS1) TaxID=930990 RepID=A0A067LXY1_BOTB1|nr:hypothetical protein BOTBODRAFT_38204 [Botryobasidium botryosum FD-172 SS1]